MKRFGCSLLIAFGLLATPVAFTGGSAFAQDVSESHLSAARKAVAASGATQRFDLLLPRILQDIKQRFIANRPDLEEVITDTANEVAISLAPRRADLEREVAVVFSKIFTEPELNELTAFYNTETGKKLLKETDVIGRQIVNASRVWGRGINRDMEKQLSLEIEKKLNITLKGPQAKEGEAKSEETKTEEPKSN